MSNLKYNAHGDTQSLKKQSDYYDKTDATEIGDLNNMKIFKSDLHKINITIPENIYQNAKRMGIEAGIGYQSILKIALVKGMKNLTL